MGFRFYRRLHLCPGLSVNLSRSGPSLSVGVRGAHVTVGRTGVTKTVGIPGTGVFYTSRQGYHSGSPGCQRAGTNLTRESLIAALEGIKGWESGILPPLTIGPDHETQKQGFWVRVEKGRFKPVTDWLKGE